MMRAAVLTVACLALGACESPDNIRARTEASAARSEAAVKDREARYEAVRKVCVAMTDTARTRCLEQAQGAIHCERVQGWRERNHCIVAELSRGEK